MGELMNVIMFVLGNLSITDVMVFIQDLTWGGTVCRTHLGVITNVDRTSS